MLPTASKGSQLANQSCRNSGLPDYLGGLLGNTPQVWPPGARRDSAAPQDGRSDLSLGRRAPGRCAAAEPSLREPAPSVEQAPRGRTCAARLPQRGDVTAPTPHLPASPRRPSN